MIWVIRKCAALLSGAAFFCLLFSSLAASGACTWSSLAGAFVRASIGASLFWIVGIIVADILLKGIVTDMESSRENLVEGGLLQQAQAIKETVFPGKSGVQFAGNSTNEKQKAEGTGRDQR